MARKNIFGLAETDPSTTGEIDHPLVNTRPLAGFEKPLRRATPVGAISQSLGGINEKAQRADDLEKQLAKGQAVVELDPLLIDSSFVMDRLSVNTEDQETLVAQIREHGQQVPILLRPHPEMPGRFQVAYGHRRLAAIKQIGGAIKAVVRDLSDEQLVVSQGQENNARTDLTFIERSFFAFRLETRQFNREIIMSALGVDKAALSRMIALVNRLPGELIEAIGGAPGFGRTRWAEIADLLEETGKRAKAIKLVQAPDFQTMTSDERFQAVYDDLRKVKDKARTAVWKTSEGGKLVRISETEAKLNLAFDKAIAPEFGSFVEARLSALYDEFMQSNMAGKGD